MVKHAPKCLSNAGKQTRQRQTEQSVALCMGPKEFPSSSSHDPKNEKEMNKVLICMNRHYQ